MLSKNLKNLILKKNNYIFLIITAYYFINLNYILHGGIIYDDWSLSANHIGVSLYEKIKINCLLFFNTRPLGGLYIAILTEFEKNDFAYISINISIWLISGLILYFSLLKYLNIQSSLAFLFIFLFPSFASTPYFSPVTQSLGVLSIFFWSLSLYFSVNKKKIFVIIFFILSLLTYEYTVVLFLINILFLSFDKISSNKKIFINNFKKFIILFLFLIIFVIAFQFFIAKITNNNAPLKYAFSIQNYQIIFEENFFNNVVKYFTKPIEIIFYEIPVLFINSLKFIDLKLYNLLIYLLILFLFIKLFKFKHKTQKLFFIKIFFVLLIFSSFFVFCMYLIVSSVPQINGYYNRGLVALFLCFAFFIAIINDYKFKNSFFNNLKFVFILLVIFLNFNSFFIQKNNYVDTEKMRDNILNNVKNNFIVNDKVYLLMIVPTYLEKNYNDETIFSEEVDDLHFAVNYVTNKKVFARRVFKHKFCKNSFEINGDKIYGHVPSRNRKVKGMVKIELMPKYDQNNFYLYLHGDNKIKKLSSNNEENAKILSKYTKCTF